MTEALERLAFVCVGLAFLILLVATMVYFLSNRQWQAWACVFSIACLGASIFREVRLRRLPSEPVPEGSEA